MAGNLRARLALIRERAVNQSSANHSGKPAPAANGSGRRDEFPAGWASTGEGVRFKETIAAFGMTAPGAPMRLAAFSPRFGSSQTAWKDVIFFDLETTGLSGGSGTVAFLAALGRWRADGTFSVRQYFIDDYPAEPRFLACLESEFASAKAVVTYNGSSFDMPLYSVRRIMNGLGAAPRIDHVDALHAARRLWRRTLVDCSLSTLERSVLGVERDDDIPGAQVPDAWFDFLKRGTTDRLARVFRHNEIDVRSLAALTVVIHQAANGGSEPVSCYLPGLAELQSRLDVELAEATLIRAMESGEERAVRPLMRLYGKHGRIDEKIALVPRLPDDAAGLFSKSVYAERREGDVRAALYLASRAEQSAEGILKDRAARRVERLRAKAEKAEKAEAPVRIGRASEGSVSQPG